MKKKTSWILAIAMALLIIGIILQYTVGSMFSAGDYSLNFFAVGDFSCGVFAAGKFACGIFSIGIFSIGIFSLGIFNVGLYAIGIFMIAWQKRLPTTLQRFS